MSTPLCSLLCLIESSQYRFVCFLLVLFFFFWGGRGVVWLWGYVDIKMGGFGFHHPGLTPTYYCACPTEWPRPHQLLGDIVISAFISIALTENEWFIRLWQYMIDRYCFTVIFNSGIYWLLCFGFTITYKPSYASLVDILRITLLIWYTNFTIQCGIFI